MKHRQTTVLLKVHVYKPWDWETMYGHTVSTVSRQWIHFTITVTFLCLHTKMLFHLKLIHHPISEVSWRGKLDELPDRKQDPADPPLHSQLWTRPLSIIVWHFVQIDFLWLFKLYTIHWLHKGSLNSSPCPGHVIYGHIIIQNHSISPRDLVYMITLLLSIN